jgi:16S rRNA G1207 methylase RsmC
MADIGPDHVCLEPSAGLGGLADLMPKTHTVCVEVSPLHCKVLEAKGHKVECADFIEWSKRPWQFGRIVMNPPYSEGRWMAHLEAAARLLATDGRLVAVLPASARGKALIEGYTHEWSEVFANEFAGTSVSVAIVAMERAA